jgi:predicted nuclease of predicted toxin-antitoxin system
VKVKLDANLGTRGQRVFAEAGHDVSTAESQGLSRAPDAVVIQRCTEEGRALVTLDTDFANAMLYPPDKHAGIVVLRTLPRMTLSDIESMLRAFLDTVGEEPLARRLLVVEAAGRVREYRPTEI